ncbi:hypothetical protein NRZ28_00360 [Aeromonas hydrophila]|uniref:hypothetical protein n=1 Tax=Aeromonas hydrophila TaxID=644 RepID=UPI00227CC017|nr:hypothetical protein [Aeromonas hydrophila]WAF90762.1 hypothetical protein NRZ33_00360 [Aeromonas hydrophila]WAG03478.1 hypothetical protein NRZ28_00360 [Aeromonas hydrophila]
MVNKKLIGILFFTTYICATNNAAAITKPTPTETSTRNFLFIENEADDNLFIAPTDSLNPRLTGANAWASNNNQDSLAYVDNGANRSVTGDNVDMWEDGPISYPYVNQRCIRTYSGCDYETAEAINKPAVVNEYGFFGLMGAASGWGHAKISASFFNYLKGMPVGSVLNRQMNLCYTTAKYDAAAGGRCKDQTTGRWYIVNTHHKKAGHIRFIQKNTVTEVIIDSNGTPFITPGSQECVNYSIGTRDGILCKYLDYDFKDDGSQSYSQPTISTSIKHSALNSAISNADVQMSADRNTWVSLGTRYSISRLKGNTSIYIFLSSNFFKQLVRLGIQDNVVKSLLNFNMTNSIAPESGFYEFNGTTEVKIKPRSFSVSILPSDGLSNPYREGVVGKDIMNFSYNISDSGPVSADTLEIAITQDIGSPYQGLCTFYPTEDTARKQEVPIPTRLSFNSTVNGPLSQHNIRCDGTPLDIRALGIQDSTTPQEWNDPVSGKGITRFYKLALEFDLTDPMVQRTIDNDLWEGEVQQSGTITIKGTWR